MAERDMLLIYLCCIFAFYQKVNIFIRSLNIPLLKQQKELNHTYKFMNLGILDVFQVLHLPKGATISIYYILQVD